MHRHLQQRRQVDRATDQAQVQQHRGEGRHRKTFPGVQNAAGQGSHRHQQYIRKGQAQQVGRQLELGGLIHETGGENIDEGRRCGDPHQHDHRQHQPERTGDLANEAARFVETRAVAKLGQHRHEGQRERALGKQPAHEIGYFEGHEEGVGLEPGGIETGDHDIPGQTEHARQ